MADFSLFDSLNPVLSIVDRVLAGLSLAPVWRIAVFAALGSLASMWLFKMLSNQAELAELKQKIGQVQKNLVRSNDESGGLGQVLRSNLKLSGRQLWLSFWPALIASIPILFLLVFCSNQFGAEAMDSGARVYVTPVELEGSPGDYRWMDINAQWDARKKAWTFYQPEQAKTATLMRGAESLLSVPTVVPTQVVHKKQWWNYLIANPAGYIDDNASAERFEFNTPTQVIINWGPGWMRGWLFAFMLFLVLFSVAIKKLWKIH